MERSQELLDVYTSGVEALNQGASPADYLSAFPDLSVIGTAPEEWWTGQDTVRQVSEAQQRANMSQRVRYTPDSPEAWADGNLGWVIDRPTLHLPDGREQQFRLTIISHRENGAWKIVHQHFSLGVPNDQVDVFRES